MCVCLGSHQIADFVPDCDAEDGNPITHCDFDYTRPADPGWGTALISMVYRHYVEYGDTRLVAEAYPAMSGYLTNLWSMVDPTTGLLNFGSFGDWNPPFDGIKVPIWWFHGSHGWSLPPLDECCVNACWYPSRLTPLSCRRRGCIAT